MDKEINIKKIKIIIYNYFQTIRKYQKDRQTSEPFQIKFFNFWKQDITDMWFYRFLLSREWFKKSNKTVSFFSVFGNRFVINLDKSDVKIFYTGENVQFYTIRYPDNALHNKKIDLALGFDYDYFDDSRYLRFPLWLLYMFNPEANEDEIKKRCSELSNPYIGERNGNITLISRYDVLGIRRNIFESMSLEGINVNCPGKFMHNDDSLWQKYNDNKHQYLQNYKFNICPENSNANGYVTEKIFQAIAAGCIPVYWGSNNNPEPEVLNHDAILFWQFGGDNSKTIELIRELNDKPQLLRNFVAQPRFKETAAETVIEMFNELDQKLKLIIENK